jgi:DNA gyrase subunit A
VFDEDQVLLITEQGMIIRVPVSTIPPKGRNIQGVRVVKMDEGDRVVAAVKVVEKEQPEEQADEDGEGPPAEEPVH